MDSVGSEKLSIGKEGDRPTLFPLHSAPTEKTHSTKRTMCPALGFLILHPIGLLAGGSGSIGLDWEYLPIFNLDFFAA